MQQVDGIIARPQLEGLLPLNGRNLPQLSSEARASGTATDADEQQSHAEGSPLLFSPVGQNGRATRVTVIGDSIMEVGNGGSAMGFSGGISGGISSLHC